MKIRKGDSGKGGGVRPGIVGPPSLACTVNCGFWRMLLS